MTEAGCCAPAFRRDKVEEGNNRGWSSVMPFPRLTFHPIPVPRVGSANLPRRLDQWPYLTRNALTNVPLPLGARVASSDPHLRRALSPHLRPHVGLLIPPAPRATSFRRRPAVSGRWSRRSMASTTPTAPRLPCTEGRDGVRVAGTRRDSEVERDRLRWGFWSVYREA